MVFSGVLFATQPRPETINFDNSRIKTKNEPSKNIPSRLSRRGENQTFIRSRFCSLFLHSKNILCNAHAFLTSVNYIEAKFCYFCVFIKIRLKKILQSGDSIQCHNYQKPQEINLSPSCVFVNTVIQPSPLQSKSDIFCVTLRCIHSYALMLRLLVLPQIENGETRKQLICTCNLWKL